MSEPTDAAAVRVFPPAIPLLTIVVGVGLSRVWPLDPGFELAIPARYWAGGLVMSIAGFGLGFPSVRLFRRSGQSVSPWKPTPRIEDDGPFRVTRNPMYLQMLVACVGVAVMFWNVWVLVLTPIGGWVLQRFAILPEEAYLERKFGDSYRAYKHRVRRWL